MTDWTCIATSGPTADGREIDPQWLIDAAETYSRNVYTAMLWPYHENDIAFRQFTANMGEVDELKTETGEDGKIRLFARLVPNQFLIEANRMGQKLFTSVELAPDFARSGRDYLIGVAVTDIPGSLGTEKLRFILNNEEYTARRANHEMFTLGGLSPRTEKKPKSILRRLFSADQASNTDTRKPDTGEDAKMDEIKALLEKLLTMVEKGTATAEGEGEADTPEEAKAGVAEIAAEIADAAAEVAELAEEVENHPEDEVNQEAFVVAKTKLADAIKAFSAVKPAKGERYRRFAARRQSDTGSDDMNALKEQLNELTRKLTAKGITPRPTGTPGEDEKPFEFI
ncbi:GPO family capsid scaffolding protein [Escherichia coli]|nr:GPO family capsid scaffolding protein [Escherichia coli]